LFGLELADGTQVEVAGTLGLSIGGFVVAAGGFSLVKQTVAGGVVDGADALVVTLTGVSVFAGVGGSLAANVVTPGTIGVSASGINATLAIVRTAGGISYTGLQLTVGSASLVGVPGITATVTAGKVNVNTSSDPARLDWKTAGASSTPLFGLEIADTTQVEVAGTLGLSIGGFVVAAGGFSLVKQTVAGGAVDGADALVVTLTGVSVFAGVGGSLAANVVTPGTIGVSASGINATLAIVRTAGGISYTGLQLTVGSASLVGIPGITATVTAGKVNVNTSSDPARLDWKTADAGSTPLFGIEIADTTQVEVAGTVGLSIGGFVVAAGGFSLVKQTVAGGTVDGADALVVTLSGVSVFAGVGGSLVANVVTPGTIGVSASGINATLAIVRTAGGISYTGLQLTVGSASLVGIPGITATITAGKVNVNTSSDPARLDWESAGAGSTPLFGIEIADTTQVEVAGTLGLSIGGFVVAAGGFSLVKQTVAGGTVDGAEALVVTLTGVSVFAGVGGSLSAANVVTPGTIGVSASGINATLAIVRTAGGISYTGLQLTVGSASLVGVPGITATVTAGKVNVNTSSDPARLDWKTAGAGSTPLFGIEIADTTQVEVAGTVGLSIGGFVVAAGGFSLVKQTVAGGTVDGADALVVTLSGVSVFAGVGGSLVANVVTPGTIGVSASGTNATLAIVHTVGGISYTGLQLTVGSANLVGVPGITATVTAGKVSVHIASDPARLDWKTAGAGSTPLFGIDIASTTQVEVAGTLGLSIGGFVVAAGGFSFGKQTVVGGRVGGA